jgi:hypothetical protein
MNGHVSMFFEGNFCPWWQKSPSVLIPVKSFRLTVGILRKFQKMNIVTEIYFNRENNVMIKKCSSRAFQWMVMSVGSDHFKIWGAISVSLPWWQKSQSGQPGQLGSDNMNATYIILTIESLLVLSHQWIRNPKVNILSSTNGFNHTISNNGPR